MDTKPSRHFEFLLAFIMVACLMLLFRNTLLLKDAQNDIEVIQSNRFTSQDFIDIIAATPENSAVIRKAMGVPPPEVTQALDSLRSRITELEANQ